MTDLAEDPAPVDLEALGELTPEELAVVAGTNGKLPDSNDLHWPEVLRLAHIHGVGPLLHRAWSSTPDAVPAKVLAELLALRRQQTMRTMVSLRERNEALTLLEGAGVPCLVLKGAALARRWYGDVSLRPIADVDLLIRKSDIAQAAELLMAAGYRPDVAMFPAYHDPPLKKPGSPSSIELHFGLTDLPSMHPVTYDEVEARAIELDGVDISVRTLGPEDTLIHLCVHTLHHVAEDGGWRLLQLSDIVHHLKAFAIDWDLYHRRADETGLGRAGDAVLGLADALCGPVDVDRRLDRSAGERLLSYVARQQTLDAYFEHGPALQAAEALSRMQWSEPFRMLSAWLRRAGPRQVQTQMQLSQDQVARPPRLLVLLREMWWLIRKRVGGAGPEHVSLAGGIRFVRQRRQANKLVHDLLDGE